MTAPNHALTGALIGLSVSNPWLAIPLAFASHFVLDAVPHYDVPGETHEARIASKKFFVIQIVGGAILCFLLVLALAITQPHNWFLAAFCAFVAASPDILSAPRFLSVRASGKDPRESNWFWRFHSHIQWKTGPKLYVVELLYGCVIVYLITLVS